MSMHFNSFSISKLESYAEKSPNENFNLLQYLMSKIYIIILIFLQFARRSYSIERRLPLHLKCYMHLLLMMRQKYSLYFFSSQAIIS